MKDQILNLIEKIIPFNDIKKRISEIEMISSQPDFWRKDENLALVEELNEKKRLLTDFENLKKTDGEEFKIALKNFLFQWILRDKYDDKETILNIYAGTGGRDAEDWVGILVRMYQGFMNRLNWPIYVLDEQSAETGGYKFISLEIPVKYSYGILKTEHGVHRLVRISPFSAKKLRHTSFAFVEVLPVIEKPTFAIKDEDIEIQTFRASGRGGQNVNKVETAVRVIYKPLNLVVVCQSERYQHRNKEKAMQMLYSKIQKILDEKHLKEIQEIKGKKIEISWGNQIRSYFFDPYKLVKDLKSKKETNKLDEVLNGKLELIHPLGEIIQSLLID